MKKDLEIFGIPFKLVDFQFSNSGNPLKYPVVKSYIDIFRDVEIGPLKVIKIGDSNFKPTKEDLDKFRDIFEKAIRDSNNFKMFVPESISIETIAPQNKVDDLKKSAEDIETLRKDFEKAIGSDIFKLFTKEAIDWRVRTLSPADLSSDIKDKAMNYKKFNSFFDLLAEFVSNVVYFEDEGDDEDDCVVLNCYLEGDSFIFKCQFPPRMTDAEEVFEYSIKDSALDKKALYRELEKTDNKSFKKLVWKLKTADVLSKLRAQYFIIAGFSYGDEFKSSMFNSKVEDFEKEYGIRGLRDLFLNSIRGDAKASFLFFDKGVDDFSESVSIMDQMNKTNSINELVDLVSGFQSKYINNKNKLEWLQAVFDIQAKRLLNIDKFDLEDCLNYIADDVDSLCARYMNKINTSNKVEEIISLLDNVNTKLNNLLKFSDSFSKELESDYNNYIIECIVDMVKFAISRINVIEGQDKKMLERVNDIVNTINAKNEKIHKYASDVLNKTITINEVPEEYRKESSMLSAVNEEAKMMDEGVINAKVYTYLADVLSKKITINDVPEEYRKEFEGLILDISQKLNIIKKEICKKEEVLEDFKYDGNKHREKQERQINELIESFDLIVYKDDSFSVNEDNLNHNYKTTLTKCSDILANLKDPRYTTLVTVNLTEIFKQKRTEIIQKEEQEHKELIEAVDYKKVVKEENEILAKIDDHKSLITDQKLDLNKLTDEQVADIIAESKSKEKDEAKESDEDQISIQPYLNKIASKKLVDKMIAESEKAEEIKEQETKEKETVEPKFKEYDSAKMTSDELSSLKSIFETDTNQRFIYIEDLLQGILDQYDFVGDVYKAIDTLHFNIDSQVLSFIVETKKYNAGSFSIKRNAIKSIVYSISMSDLFSERSVALENWIKRDENNKVFSYLTKSFSKKYEKLPEIVKSIKIPKYEEDIDLSKKVVKAFSFDSLIDRLKVFENNSSEYIGVLGVSGRYIIIPVKSQLTHEINYYLKIPSSVVFDHIINNFDVVAAELQKAEYTTAKYFLSKLNLNTLIDSGADIKEEETEAVVEESGLGGLMGIFGFCLAVGAGAKLLSSLSSSAKPKKKRINVEKAAIELLKPAYKESAEENKMEEGGQNVKSK